MSFIIVSYPWPVPSAHVELAGTSRQARRTRETTRTTAASLSQNPEGPDQPATEPDHQPSILTASKV